MVRKISWLLVAVCAIAMPTAEARWHRLLPTPQPPGPVTGYRPQTNVYAVVAPQTVAGPRDPRACLTGKSPVWQARATTPQAYPYGWFGARTTPQASAHERYDQNTLDFKFLDSP